MNRKGDLTREILGVIIALIGLLIIASIIWKLYNLNISQDEENANNILDSVMAKINAIEEGQNTSLIIQGFNGANEWYLVGWNKDDSLNLKPEMCFDTSCICACKGPTKQDCESEGVCRRVEGSVAVYTEPFEIAVFSTGGLHSGTVHAACIPLKSNLVEIKVGKLTNLITLSKTEETELVREGETYNRVFSCTKLPMHEVKVT